jgi:trk system potassium uptake protein TrkA
MYFIIAGCMTIGASLAQILSEENHDVVVIDSDPKNLEALGSGFNGVTITGMPIDEDVLRNAGIEQADALAAVTRDDNMNVMIAQVAQKLFHVPKVITRLYSPERELVFREMGMTTVCPTSLAVNSIKEMLLPDPHKTVLSIGGSRIPFQTVAVSQKSVGKKISALQGLRILGIIRSGTFIFAGPECVVEANDLLIMPENAKKGGDQACIS